MSQVKRLRLERYIRPPTHAEEELAAEVARLEAQCAAMREALEGVEWEGGYAGDIVTSAAWCPECEAERNDGHTASCSVGQALATDAGAKMLAKVALMREALEQVEYVDGGDDHSDDYCPWCIALRWEGRHYNKCERQAALDAGEVTG